MALVSTRVNRRTEVSKSQLSKGLVAAMLLTLSCVCWGTTKEVTYRGDASVATVTVLGITTTVNGTGALPKTGGELNNDLLTLNVPGIVSAGVSHASTIGLGNHTDSSASLAGLSVGLAGLVVTADIIESQASAEIANGAPTTSGGSTLVNLVVAGQSIIVSGFRNQTVVIPGGKVVINEMTQSAGAITVNALHISLAGIADVILGSSFAAVGPCTSCSNTCSATPNCTANNDFITASGALKDLSGLESYLGVSLGSLSGGKNWGSFAFQDLGSLISFVSSTVNTYQITSTTERIITGTGLLNGVDTVNYTLKLVQGDLGTGTFTLALSNGYSISGSLDVGFIQIRQTCN
jgi:hypothetical protein